MLMIAVLLGGLGPFSQPGAAGSEKTGAWLAPSAMAMGADGKTLFIACFEANCVEVLDLASGRVLRTLSVPGKPSGLVLAPQANRLYVTCSSAESRICRIDPDKGALEASFRTGHTALSPVLSGDGATLFFCLRFNDQVAVWDIASGREIRRIAVGREPFSLAPTPDGQFLFVAHHLPSGKANVPEVAATIGVIDLRAGAMLKERALPNGSSLVREIRLSPDGRHAVVTHNLARFQVPTTQLERGWMNTSALTILDVQTRAILSTVLLDDVDRGAANPWAAAFSGDGKLLFISHAGTHELSAIDFPKLLAKIGSLAGGSGADASETGAADDLAFLAGLRMRVKLHGNGPRSMVVTGHQVCVAGYFSDSLDIVDLDRSPLLPRSLPLQAQDGVSDLRRGEQLFNDASICFEGWQSCASCHSSDARVDGLNWDLLNDGVGNPKNSKSLLLAHQTPPAMSMGVRYTAEEAVRAGLQHILFAPPSEEVARPIDQWLRSLKPGDSPRLVGHQLSASATRGRKLFNSTKSGCSSCHKPGLFTDLQSYDVGTAGNSDRKGQPFDTPTLVELWRTAPYLHDGSAATVRDVLTSRNPNDRHGRTSGLTETELDDLVEYLLSL